MAHGPIYKKQIPVGYPVALDDPGEGVYYPPIVSATPSAPEYLVVCWLQAIDGGWIFGQ